jgi:protein involved in polysaccharide export with SLBB domain
MMRYTLRNSFDKGLRGFFSFCIASAALFCSLLLGSGVHAQTANGASSKPTPTALSSYQLAAGDVITIRVFGEDDLSREKVKLTDAGTIPYPVLGEIKALGLTIGEIERFVTNGLNGKYLVNPRVSVTIEEYRPFYINGMVEKPGAYPFQPGLTVLKASSLAGGFKERASFSKISIIREGDSKAKPQKADINTPVSPGDTIFIEESFF